MHIMNIKIWDRKSEYLKIDQNNNLVLIDISEVTIVWRELKII